MSPGAPGEVEWTRQVRRALGRALRARSRALGWSQQRIGEELSLSQSHISRTFSGSPRGRLAYERVAECIGVDLDELIRKLDAEGVSDTMTDEERARLGVVLAARASSTGVTQAELAQRVGSARNSVRRVLRGQVRALDRYEQVAVALDWTLAAALDALDEPSPKVAPVRRARVSSSASFDVKTREQLGRRLRDELKQRDRTYPEWADDLGVSLSTLHMVLRGASRHHEHYLGLLDALGLTLDEVLLVRASGEALSVRREHFTTTFLVAGVVHANRSDGATFRLADDASGWVRVAHLDTPVVSEGDDFAPRKGGEGDL